jgi:two-component system LytT family response regulator
MMKAIIIDDEKPARISLDLLLKEFCPEIKVVAQCENLPEGVKAIRKLQPDLVLLDIEMPGHSGLELLDFFDVQIEFQGFYFFCNADVFFFCHHQNFPR